MHFDLEYGVIASAATESRKITEPEEELKRERKEGVSFIASNESRVALMNAEKKLGEQ